jgi:hypothetical protein
MAGIQFGFRHGVVDTKVIAMLEYACGSRLEAVEANSNGLFLFYGGFETEESAQNTLEATAHHVPSIVLELSEASPTL